MDTPAIRDDEVLVRVHAASVHADVWHLVTGRPAWIPLGTTANKTGRVAGANAAGFRERFPGIAGTCIVSVFDVGFAATSALVLASFVSGAFQLSHLYGLTLINSVIRMVATPAWQASPARLFRWWRRRPARL